MFGANNNSRTNNDGAHGGGGSGSSSATGQAQKKRSMIVGSMLILSGVICFATNMIVYPYLLPKVLTSENSNLTITQSYLFYLVFFASILQIAIGIRKLCQSAIDGYDRRSVINYTFLAYRLFISFARVVSKVLYDRKYRRLFWLASICYGIFYALVSNMIIYRPEGFLLVQQHVVAGSDSATTTTTTTIPSSLIMQYGTVGYVPAVAITLTENIGLLILPINLSILLFTSVMIGLNIVLSVYLLKNRPRISMRGSFLASAGASMALFSVCPTCASFYLFSAVAGPLAFTISAFTASFYFLFALISIPSLIAGAAITTAGIHKTLMATKSCGFTNNSP
jgi:hypothetical protein